MRLALCNAGVYPYGLDNEYIEHAPQFVPVIVAPHQEHGLPHGLLAFPQHDPLVFRHSAVVAPQHIAASPHLNYFNVAPAYSGAEYANYAPHHDHEHYVSYDLQLQTIMLQSNI